MNNLFVSALLLTIVTPCSAQDNSILGCWGDGSVIQYFADGSHRENSSSKCSLQFSESQIISRCISAQGESIAKYSYKITRTGVYQATITSHNQRPDLVGNTREYAYQATATNLTITTEPQTSKPTPPTAAIRVVSESSRITCQ
jgi:hypothetical protein